MEVKDYINEIENGERRFLSFETRADDEGNIEGIASRVDEPYDLGWFEERIAKGAFDGVLGDDVRVLFNHNPDYILGRTSAGTAEVYLNDAGDLAYRYKTPNTTVGKDLEENIRTGNVSQSSFAFTVEEDEWTERDGKDVRTITKVKRLYDVSPVTYPASPSTSVAKRSHDKVEKPNADKTVEEGLKYEYKRNNYKRKIQILKSKK